MKKEINLCMGCMNKKNYSGPCAICGYMDNTAYLPNYLAPKTFLANRYVIGKLLSVNGEGALYLAYDTEQGQTVEIREYFPEPLCTRKKDEETVSVNDGCLPLYKTYLSEFADLYKTLMHNEESECIRKVFNIFAANNTGYVVMEHLNAIPLSDFLEENGGRLDWETPRGSSAPSVRELFPPLLTALNLLNSSGIIHRGLSPESIYVDNRGQLKLTSFGSSASRTADSSIKCELFAGYAAPEQYDVSERQGSWTDIYGICAVLYRVLSGKEPQEANSRELNDCLEELYRVNPTVPKNVSDAVMSGLELRYDNRIHKINELVAKLFEQPKEQPVSIPEPEDDGPISPVVSHEPRRPSNSARPVTNNKNIPQRRPVKPSGKKKKKEKSNIGAILGGSVFFAIVVGFIIAIAYFSDATHQLQQMTTTTTEAETTSAPVTVTLPEITTVPEDTVSADTTTQSGSPERLLLPDFKNRFYSTLENRYSMLKFNPTYEYNDEYAEGLVFEQDIEPNTEVIGGTEINVKVSMGPEYVMLPDYIGKKLDKYKTELSEAGIKYDTEAEETTEVKAGYVVRCSKEIGEKIKLSEDESVIVYYAVKPENTETEAPSSEPENTEASPEDSESEDPAVAEWQTNGIPMT